MISPFFFQHTQKILDIKVLTEMLVGRGVEVWGWQTGQTDHRITESQNHRI